MAAWFTEIAERTAVMIAKWQAVGFTHGVMNTDNMSILGLTIDYGPFGFLDAFDPKYTPNTTDLPGRRYGFANQPDIGLWNVMQLANTLYTAELITADEAQFGLGRYADKFMSLYQQHMSSKIGLKEYNKDLLSKLLSNMAFDKVDYTNFFRSLSNVKAAPTTSDDDLIAPLKNALLDLSKERRKVWLDWLHSYVELVSTISSLLNRLYSILVYYVIYSRFTGGRWLTRVYQKLKGKLGWMLSTQSMSCGTICCKVRSIWRK